MDQEAGMLWSWWVIRQTADKECLDFELSDQDSSNLINPTLSDCLSLFQLVPQSSVWIMDEDFDFERRRELRRQKREEMQQEAEK